MGITSTTSTYFGHQIQTRFGLFFQGDGKLRRRRERQEQICGRGFPGARGGAENSGGREHGRPERNRAGGLFF